MSHALSRLVACCGRRSGVNLRWPLHTVHGHGPCGETSHLRWRGFVCRPAPGRPRELSGVEFQRYYDTGRLPERHWPEEEAKLRRQFTDGEITLQELEDSLDDMTGITLMEQGFEVHEDDGWFPGRGF